MGENTHTKTERKVKILCNFQIFEISEFGPPLDHFSK